MNQMTAAQRDRFCGVLLGTAAGDALGAGYEFGPPLADEAEVAMKGGGGFGWAPGEWTDDTSMAIAIAEVAATGGDLRESGAQDAIVSRWVEWSLTASDVGNQTRRVFDSVRREPDGGSAASAARASKELHERTAHTAGNGSLMRTAPVALAYLNDEDALIEAAQAISALTHFDPEAGEACRLWCAAIRHAVLTGELDVRVGLRHLGADRRSVWADRLDVAERSRPSDFRNNGWVVEALQGAWSAIASTAAASENNAAHLRRGLEAAVRGGRDADTVAAIAGGLLGAAYGASAIPAEWRRVLHGWPGMNGRELVALAGAIDRRGEPDAFDFTYRRFDLSALAQHPYDDQVWLGGLGALRELPAGVTGVVSLCRVGDDDAPPSDVAWIESRLIDTADPQDNPHLEHLLEDAVGAVESLRAEGRSVLIHCVQAHSRTPAVAALYGMRLRGVTADEALADVCAALPGANPNRRFRQVLRELEGRS